MPYTKKDIAEKYELLRRVLAQKNMDVDQVKDRVSKFTVEVPSWTFGAFGGGRFSGYVPRGAARNIYEKLDDAATINKLTGATPKVSIHVGWDDPDNAPFDKIQPDSFKKLKDYAQSLGLDIGSVNPTYFLEGTQYGSLSANNPETRERLIEHTVVASEIAAKYATGILTLWLPDGSIYPGQVNLRTVERNLQSSLKEIYRRAPQKVKMLIEYKLFEPGTYHTAISDVSVAWILAINLGGRAGVIIDLGHHPHGTNIEHIVARLIENQVPGGFHFNTRYAADDDHAVEPNIQVFRIFHELVTGNVIGNPNPEKNWVYVIDQSSTLENRIQAVLHSVDSLTVSYAKALCVDEEKLRKHQSKNEIIQANRTFLDAFLTDVRPIIHMARLERNLPADPVEAYVNSGYQENINQERKQP